METLDQLAADIHADIAHREEGRAQWIEGTLRLCEHLAVARNDFGDDDRAFGKWCDSQRFTLNHQDRAAAITMGQDLERAREVLENTERRSIRLIAEKEFIFTSAGKDEQPKESEPTKKKRVIGDKLETAIKHVVQAMEEGNPLSDDKLAKEIGVSHLTIEKAKALIHHSAAAQAIVLNMTDPVDVDQFSKSKQTEFERWKRQAERAIREEIRREIMDEAKKLYNEHVLPEIVKKHDRAERIINAYKGFIPRAAFRKVLACLHPDQADEGRKSRYSEAFQIFKELESVLVAPEEAAKETRGPALPSTLGELMAMKKTKR